MDKLEMIKRQINNLQEEEEMTQVLETLLNRLYWRCYLSKTGLRYICGKVIKSIKGRYDKSDNEI